jgi:2-polyprenyl-3-methyl-5-hydroxy-6-metoxy-1,4-benzoquinol methylase
MNVRKKNVDGFELSFSSNWIKHLEAQEHWGFYWHQARLIEDRVPQDNKMLEIGVGTKFLSNYLASRGRSITTLDIDEDKAPDYVEDASSFDYGALNLDTVLAFEIFEHLPFPLFCRVIERLAECQVNQIIFSVPWCEKKLLRGQIKFPRMNPYRFSLTLPWRSVTTETTFGSLIRSGY